MIDLIAVQHPLGIELAKQSGAKFTATKLPRSLMKSPRSPSDHTSVIAVVEKREGQ